MTKLFGTSGIRAVLGKELTVYDVIKIVLSTARYFDYSPVLIGWDCRIHSKPLAMMAASLLQIYGVDVATAGIISTPSMQKYLGTKRERYGIMFTASHNPPEYFGIKIFYDNGVEIYGEAEKKITDIYETLDLPNVDWGLSKEDTIDLTEDVISTYIDFMSQYIEKLPLSTEDFVVGVDFSNCSAVSTAGRFLSTLGLKMIYLNNVIDGRFPGRMPEPNRETLKKTLEALKGKIDVGVAFDGDADRGLVFDGYGDIYWGDQIGALTALHLSQELGIDTIVTPISTSHKLMKFLENTGFKVIYTPVGAKHIVSKMITYGYNFGFEENGGLVYLPHIPGRDGLLTFLFTLSFMTKTKSKLREISEILPKTFVIKKKVKIKGDKAAVMEELSGKVMEKYMDVGCEATDIDGIKLICSDFSILVRPSGTEPLIRIFVEHDSMERAEKISEEIVEMVKEIDKRITYL